MTNFDTTVVQHWLFLGGGPGAPLYWLNCVFVYLSLFLCLQKNPRMLRVDFKNKIWTDCGREEKSWLNFESDLEHILDTSAATLRLLSCAVLQTGPLCRSAAVLVQWPVVTQLYLRLIADKYRSVNNPLNACTRRSPWWKYTWAECPLVWSIDVKDIFSVFIFSITRLHLWSDLVVTFQWLLQGGVKEIGTNKRRHVPYVPKPWRDATALFWRPKTVRWIAQWTNSFWWARWWLVLVCGLA